MDHIWKHGGGEHYFDISERSCLERITRALHDMKERSDEIEEEAESVSGAASRHCEMIANFFDTVLGDGKAADILGETAGAEECSAAYVSFILFVRDEVDSLARLRAALEAKLEEIGT